MNVLLDIIKKSCVEISDLIRFSNSYDIGNETNHKNTSGDIPKILDEMSHNILKDEFEKCNLIRGIISEEQEDIYLTKHTSAKYIISFDPLDGSSNISVNISIGTIFCVYELNGESNAIKNGRDIVMAGYSLYGGSTELVVATYKNVSHYGLNKSNEFVIMKDNIQIPNKQPFYSINEGYKHKWLDSRTANFIRIICTNRSLRYVGSLVADAHRTLLKGGVFIYPRDSNYRHGKIRLLYEAYPFAYIFEQCGGSSYGENGNILDIPCPLNLHQPIPFIIGSKDDIELYELIK